MIDFGRILAEAIEPVIRELDAGEAGLLHWRALFAKMHSRLQDEGATADQCQAFMSAISRAIEQARGLELSDAENAAMHDVLWSVFSGHPTPRHRGLSPRSGFLKYVSFLSDSVGAGASGPLRKPSLRLE